jgi:Xaa-Pro aminopeptidase
MEWAGTSIQDKINTALDKSETDHVLVVALDEVAWVLNLRGNDIEYNPVFFSYLVLTKEPRKLALFVNAEKLGECAEYLRANSVEIHPYDSCAAYLAGLSGTVQVPGGDCNLALYSSIKEPVDEDTPIAMMKAVKSAREI